MWLCLALCKWVSFQKNGEIIQEQVCNSLWMLYLQREAETQPVWFLMQSRFTLAANTLFCSNREGRLYLKAHSTWQLDSSSNTLSVMEGREAAGGRGGRTSRIQKSLFECTIEKYANLEHIHKKGIQCQLKKILDRSRLSCLLQEWESLHSRALTQDFQ